MSQRRCTILLLVVYSAIAATLDVVSIPGNGACPAQERREAAIQSIRASVQTTMDTTPNLADNLNCGSGEWYRVAHLNMSNSSQQCPSAWREYNTSGVRGCRRPQTLSPSCSGIFYATNHRYSRVCGRVIGYQIGTTDAFGLLAAGHTIDSYYVYGVSVTHGAPRSHIWTLAAGFSEGEYITQGWDCPCVDPSIPGNVFPPSFVGNNYYCESGNRNPIDVNTRSLTLSGMASSVRVSVAAMENLLHGSVWSYQTQQLTILRCAFVILKEVLMTLPSSYLSSTFSTIEIAQY